DRKLLLRVFTYVRPYWFFSLIVLIAILLSSALELIPPLLYRELIDHVLPTRDLTSLHLLALAMIGIPVVSGLTGIVQRYYSAKMGEGIIYDLRAAMYTHLQKMSIRFFTNTKSGEIISSFTNDVVGAQNAVTGTLPSILTSLITLVSTIVVMVTIEWRLTLLSVAVFPLFLLPVRHIGRLFRKIRRKSMKLNANMNSIVQETLGINGALLTKTFGRQNDENAVFLDNNRQVMNIGVQRALVGRWFFMGLGIASAIGTALIYWAGGRLVMDGHITVGTIVAFAAYLTRLYTPVSTLSNVHVELATSMVSFERVFEILDLPVDIQDTPDAFVLQKVQGQVRFEKVYFSYMVDRSVQSSNTENDKTSLTDDHSFQENRNNGDGSRNTTASPSWALHELSFEIEPGQLAALVGPSGAGKTTVTYLLPRLYDVTHGQITLDGHDIRDVTQRSLAEQIGMVTQESYLFHDTIRANLLYARPEATDADLTDACKAAYLHDLISSLPQGYDTVVGERGYRLSAGEKQRLAIARVILKDPRILILDEATSHLDSHSETLIQSALEGLFKNRTSLVIAHRLSTILAADKILVLNNGHLVEEGTHSVLLAKGGLYAGFYEEQFGKGQKKHL
ncbi:MAG TPA: ABC transporter ATP-binding protein, partial [Thermodesulfovibrionia bacterium]|nr:ABC transporter ATP-binding protein [Thermodesulfovibrionia bacterium]